MELLFAFYQHALTLENATFSRIDHNDAMVAIVYKVTDFSGMDFILKICPRPQDFVRELFFLRHFADLLPVPRIIDVVQPQANIFGAVLMECLPGAVLKVADVTPALAYELGLLLAQIHLNKTLGYGDLIEPQELSHNPRTYFTYKFEEGFAECRDHLPKVLLEQCRRYYDMHSNLLLEVDAPSIVHRDFRPGNVIVNNGKLQGIIDWSSARASFAQEDFCSLEHGDWSSHSAGKKAFLAGYAAVCPVPRYDAIMPLLRLSRAFATIGCMVKTGTWNGRNAGIYTLNRQYLETFKH